MAHRHAESDTDDIRAVTRRLVELDEKPTAELAAMYEKLRGEPPRSWHRTHLLHALAYDIQEASFGGLSRRARRRMGELGRYAPAAWRGRLARAGMRGASDGEPAPPVSEAPTSDASRSLPKISDMGAPARVRSRDARLPPPGTVIVRVYDGREHRVVIGERTFEYEGHTYKSPTAVAKAITGGTQWNGFSFLGLSAEAK
jgi:hypothetical protein